MSAGPDTGLITPAEVSAQRLVCTVPAAGGLWTTAADLVRFGRSWSSLLPAGGRHLPQADPAHGPAGPAA